MELMGSSNWQVVSSDTTSSASSELKLLHTQLENLVVDFLTTTSAMDESIPQWQKDMRESIQILKTLEPEPWSVSRSGGTSGAVVAGAPGSGSRLADEVGGSGHSGDAIVDVDEEREKRGRQKSKLVTAKPKSRSRRSASSGDADEVEVREKRPRRKMKRLNAKPKTRSARELCKLCFKDLSVKSLPYHLNKSRFHLQDRLNGIIGTN